MLDGLSDFFAGQEFGVVYIISQFFALVAMVFGLIAVHQKKKVQLLNFSFLSSFCAMSHYLFLGAWSGTAMKIISTMRNGTAAYEAFKHRTSRILPIIFVTFYVVSGIITYESFFSLLPMIANSIFTVAAYMGDIKTIRYVSTVSSLLWLIYNLHILSLVGVVSEAIFITNDFIAIYRYRSKKRRCQNKREGRKKKA